MSSNATLYILKENRGSVSVMKTASTTSKGGELAFTIFNERGAFMLTLEHEGKTIRVAQIAVYPTISIQICGVDDATTAVGLIDLFRGAAEKNVGVVELDRQHFRWLSTGRGECDLERLSTVTGNWVRVVAARWQETTDLVWDVPSPVVWANILDTLTLPVKIAVITGIWFKVYGIRKA